MEKELYLRNDTSAYLDNVIHLINDILSSPESGLLLRELYLDNYTSKLSTTEELVFGDSLYRTEEGSCDYNAYRAHIRDYINYDIHKFFKLNINEYLETTTYMKLVMVEEAVVKIKELNKERDSLNTDNDSLIKDLEGMTYE